MGQSGSREVEASLLEKMWDLLERKPENYDVAFCVGREKKIVKALKIVLKASSPFLEKEFEEKWEVAVVKEGDGIPLPDFDPTAFELFVKLTTLDTWSLEILKAMNVLPNQILNLLLICRSFEMTKPVEILEELAATFMQSFGEYKDTDDFLQLSQTNLKSVLGSENIRIKEFDVFHSAIRWAEFQCKKMKVKATDKRIREVLGDCLFEIRFPIMTFAEFTKTAESNDVLTAQETIEIYRFIGLVASKKSEFDAKTFSFKTAERKQIQTLESKPNSETDNSEAIIPLGTSTLSLAQGCKIVETPPFVCDGSQKYHEFTCEKKVKVYGLGFFGPIENDGFYDTKVQITQTMGILGITYDSGMLEKRIFARKGKKFYFVFDAPIRLKAVSVSQWKTFYRIDYYLKGANTSACSRKLRADFIVEEGDTKFGVRWGSNQLAEIMYK